MSSATITVTGNLGRDAELKYTQSGRPVLSFNIAHTPARKNDQGKWEDTGDTQWYRCSLWGKAAELYSSVLVKGQVGQVTVSGRFVPSIFDGSDGPRLSLDIAVDSIGVRESRGQQQGVQAPAGGSVSDPWASTVSSDSGQSFSAEAPF